MIHDFCPALFLPFGTAAWWRVRCPWHLPWDVGGEG
jgi:hypothetical protein